jgi:hypothetical protein
MGNGKSPGDWETQETWGPWETNYQLPDWAKLMHRILHPTFTSCWPYYSSLIQ